MEGNLYQEKIAKILRVPKKSFFELAVALERVTGKTEVIETIFSENERIVGEKLMALGVSHDAYAQEVYDALVSKVEADNLKLLGLIGHSSLRGYAASSAVVEFTKRVYGGPRRGFFLKREKAREFLRAVPPPNILKALGYGTVDEMLKKEDLDEVYAALRFLEDSEWQNTVFFKQYEGLTPHDFEEREIVMRALSEKWTPVAEQFVVKKYHNVSHLKELGVIFVIPIFLGISGETLRLLALLLHYFYEVSFYADAFRARAKERRGFAKDVISMLRGDVIEKRLPEELSEIARPRFLVVQRYLGKIDPNDWRLAEPHVNPEALHWQRAEEDIMQIDGQDLQFWSGACWVGDFFKTDLGEDSLISFNLGDVVMTLVKRKEIKYLYHEQEALWNKIFIEYFGEKRLEAMSRDHIVEGWFGM
jgi:hypothetical protein